MTTADAPPGCSLCPPGACHDDGCPHALPKPRRDRLGVIHGGKRFLELWAEYERELGAANEPDPDEVLAEHQADASVGGRDWP